MRPHTFSMRRLLMLASIGAVFFIPGIVLTIVGLEKTEEEEEQMQGGQRIMYQAVGPAFTTLGVAFLFSACVYYYCYGTGESNRMPGGSHQVNSSINSDPAHHHHGHHHRGHHHHHHHHLHHHHNGSQLNTPDGSVRRLSFKDEVLGHADPAIRQEEQVPLAPPEYDSLHSPPPVAIRVDRAPDVPGEDEAQEREQLVNGEVTSRDPSPV
nr:hypothetical protein BaRGS_000351 [Batillaria attramentaria]